MLQTMPQWSENQHVKNLSLLPYGHTLLMERPAEQRCSLCPSGGVHVHAHTYSFSRVRQDISLSTLNKDEFSAMNADIAQFLFLCNGQ